MRSDEAVILVMDYYSEIVYQSEQITQFLQDQAPFTKITASYDLLTNTVSTT